MIPAASVATSVTSARPIISAAAVDAVRCGFRRAFSAPTRDVERSGTTPGNSTGHSGSHRLTALRIHIRSTITRISGLRIAPPRNARMRSPTSPGPHAPLRSSQYGSVKKGQKTTEKRKTAQRATGDMTTARRGISRVETRATPKKTSSTPTPIHRSTLVVPRPGTNSPYRSAPNPRRYRDERSDRARREERAPEQDQDQPERPRAAS